MRRIFGLSLAASGLYQNGVSAYPIQAERNFYITSGYICDKKILLIDDLREEADKAYETLKRRAFINEYPALFEDFYLLDDKVQTLFSWPILDNVSPIKSGPAGKYRLIIDINKNVIGVVATVSPKNKTDQKEFTKCEPIHQFTEKDDYITKLWIRYLDQYYKTLGFICDGEFIDQTAYLYTLNIIKQHRAGYGRKTSSVLINFTSFTDKHDSNLTLYGYPLRNLNTKGYPSGPVNTHRIIFYLQNDNKEVVVKAVVSSGHDDKRCPRVWSLSSSHTTHKKSSPIIRAVQLNNDYQFKCANVHIKASTIHLQVDFAREQARYATYPHGINYPILLNGSLRLWPLRFPESSTMNFEYVFVMGFDSNLKFQGIFYALNIGTGDATYYACPNS